MSEDEKVRQYSQTLQNYLTYYNQRKNQPIHVKLQPSPPPIKETEQTDTPQEAQNGTQEPREAQKSTGGEIERDIVQALPKSLKDRGKRLLENIKENSDVMKWDDKGQLVLDGKSQQGTHISDLIKDSLRASKNDCLLYTSPSPRDS